MKRLSLGVLFFLGCAHAPSVCAPSPVPASGAPKAIVPREGEGHLEALRQLTFEGENAEAYWAFSGRALTFQARHGGEPCDRIYWLDARTGATRPISSGEGVTTCAYALPGDDEVLDYQALLAQGLVRPTKLELYVADADGSHPTQLTYLNVASFAPAWHPTRERILFSSNYPDARGREFDIWAVNVDGTGLERITTAPGFDGFPLFSPDGKQLAFSSNRETAPGRQDTNVFLAEWNEAAPEDSAEPRPADRVMEDVRFLAAPEREGRGVDTAGLEQAARYLEERFTALGLVPAGDAGGFRQRFSIVTEVKPGRGTALELGGLRAKDDALLPLGFSADGEVGGDVVLAGYGVRAKELGVDDYAGLAVKGKIVVVRRFVPEQPAFATSEAQRRYGDLRHKAWVAKEAGARALIVADWPAAASPGAGGGPVGGGAAARGEAGAARARRVP